MTDLLETEAVIFDSSVLLKLDIKGMRSKMKEIIKNHADHKRVMGNYVKAFKQYQKGIIKNDIKFFKEVFKGLRMPQRKIKNLIIRHDNWRKKYVKLNPHAKKVINILSKDYRLGLISNMPKKWFNNDTRMTGLNHKRILQSEIFSQEAGIPKPDIRIFKRSIRELFTDPERCAYVTNHLSEVKGAGMAGMQVIFIGERQAGDYTIKNLGELIDLFITPDVTEPQEVKVRDK